MSSATPPTSVPTASTSGAAAPDAPSAVTLEAIKIAPAAVRRSMPMALSIALGILLAGLIGWFFHYLVGFMLVLYLSFVAATILEAPVQWLRRRGIRRGLAALIIMVGGLAIVSTGLYFAANSLFGQINALSSNLDQALNRINSAVNEVRKHFIKKSSAGTDSTGVATRETRLGVSACAASASAPATTAATAPTPDDFDIRTSISNGVPSIATVFSNATSGIESLSWLVITFFLVLYMLVDGADHLKAIRRLFPKHARLEATHLFNAIAQANRGWALASCANVISASLLLATGLYLLSVPGALLLGIFAGLGELIPNIGPILGAMPALLLTLIADPEKFPYVLGMFIIVQTIQSYAISPRMLKFSMELPVLVTLISVLVFAILFGFLGVMVAIPLVADLVVLWQYVNRYIEKDTEDYDAVNAPVVGERTALAHDGPSRSRMQSFFGTRRNRPDAPPAATAGSPAPASGLDRLENAERKSTANP